FSSARKLTMRPDTCCGATLTICASTNASSVMECPRRYSTQGKTRGTDNTPRRMRSKRNQCLARKCLHPPAGAAGETVDAATGCGAVSAGAGCGLAVVLGVVMCKSSARSGVLIQGSSVRKIGAFAIRDLLFPVVGPSAKGRDGGRAQGVIHLG